MELRQLRHLTAVLERRSFAAAANELHITQPALSKSLRKLELTLGVRLLDRGPSGVRPTVYGEHLATYAHLVLAQVAEAEQEIGALRGARKGWLRLGAAPAALRTIVPAAVYSFLADRPTVQLSIIEGLSEHLVGMLRRSTLDLIVTAMPTEPFDADIEFRVLQQEPMMIVSSPDHPFANRKRIQLAELTPYRWIVPDRLEPDRRHLDRLFASAGLAMPEVVLETTSITLLPAVLSHTEYLTYLPQSSLSAETASSYVALPLATPTWTRTTAAAFRRKGPLRPLLGRFLQSLAAACARAPTGAT